MKVSIRKWTENKRINLSFIHSVKMKLIGVFLIPVVFIVILGIVSYHKSSGNMIENYEQSSLSTLEMMTNYFSLGFEQVAAKTNQFITNESIKKYYSGNFEGDSLKEMEQYKVVQNILTSSAMDDSIVQDIYIFADYGSGVSTRGTLPKNLYETFKASEEGIAFIESKNRFQWSGYHHYFDETVNTEGREYGLALTYYLYSMNNKKIGLILIDVKKDFLTEAMVKTNFGPGSIVGLVTMDGKEILTGDYPEDFSFTGTDYYQRYLPQMDDEGLKVQKTEPSENATKLPVKRTAYVTHDGKPYLYLYLPLKEQNAMVCALIPENMITKQSDEMLEITLAIVFLASIIAIAAGSFFAAGITRTIKRTNEILHKTAEGNLTVKASLSRKDEFHQLSQGINNMIQGMKELLQRTTAVSRHVAEDTGEVSNHSALLLMATEEITRAVEEIEQGANLQAGDAEECLNQMSTLSEQISVVGEKADNIEEIAKLTQTIVKKGTVIVDDLSEKAKDTVNITQEVICDIEELEKKSIVVNNIIGTIDYITEQTNLLSLNASIEAARAGEFGRGFAVVAEEIRKLASQSQKAAKQIGDIIDEIVKQTKETVDTARKAESIVAAQELTLKSTVDVFFDIDIHVVELTGNLQQIIAGITGIEKTKEDTLKAVSNITSTTQQTAAATGELGATAVNQMGSVEALNNAAAKLKEAVQDLEQTVGVFITETEESPN